MNTCVKWISEAWFITTADMYFSGKPGHFLVPIVCFNWFFWYFIKSHFYLCLTFHIINTTYTNIFKPSLESQATVQPCKTRSVRNWSVVSGAMLVFTSCTEILFTSETIVTPLSAQCIIINKNGWSDTRKLALPTENWNRFTFDVEYYVYLIEMMSYSVFYTTVSYPFLPLVLFWSNDKHLSIWAGITYLKSSIWRENLSVCNWTCGQIWGPFSISLVRSISMQKEEQK